MAESNSQILRSAELPIREFLARTQALLDTLNEEGVEATGALRERIAASIDSVRGRIEHLPDTFDESVSAIEGVIRENPWASLTVGAVIGVAAGCLATAAISSAPSWTDSLPDTSDLTRQSRPYIKRARKAIRDNWPF
jgi:ElaB/YqjD/DUF883 family membrane-anchored ribosome-binding protein